MDCNFDCKGKDVLQPSVLYKVPLMLCVLVLVMFQPLVSQPACPPSCAIPSAPWPKAESFREIPTFPDPFMTTSGGRVNSTADWTAHRNSLIDMLEHYMMGTTPSGRPAILTGVRVNDTAPVSINGTNYARLTIYNITVGPSSDCTNSFLLWLYLPTSASQLPYPVFIFNSDSPNYYDLTAAERAVLTTRGFAIAEFDRVQLRTDDKLIGPNTDKHSIQRCYDKTWTWGTLAVWAWGGSRVMDFLVNGIGFDASLRSSLDLDSMMSIGHSRGGKVALWQGVKDERVKIAFPLMSGEGGCASFRVPMHTASPKPVVKPEDIHAITTHFPNWFVPEFKKFERKEICVPFDGHFHRALLAPRACMAMEGATDWHINPEGSQATFEATSVVYEWMGVRDQIGIHYHTGEYPDPSLPWNRSDHPMSLNDFTVVADFVDYSLHGRVPQNGTSEFEVLPFNISVETYRLWAAPTAPAPL
jgi:hypothetical protein